MRETKVINTNLLASRPKKNGRKPHFRLKCVNWKLPNVGPVTLPHFLEITRGCSFAVEGEVPGQEGAVTNPAKLRDK